MNVCMYCKGFVCVQRMATSAFTLQLLCVVSTGVFAFLEGQIGEAWNIVLSWS